MYINKPIDYISLLSVMSSSSSIDRDHLSFSGAHTNLINGSSSSSSSSSSNIISSNILLRIFLVTCQSFLLGYNLASLNACLVKCGTLNDDGYCSEYPGTIYNDIKLLDNDIQIATSLLVIGAWIGCLIGSIPCEIIGRRKTLLLNCFFYIIGGIIEGISNKNCLYIGKLLTGIGTGISSVLCPLLLSEISSIDTRGFITTLHQVNVTIAIFFADIMGFIFVNNVKHGWVYVQVFTIIPAIIQLIFSMYIPESPKWLLSKGNSDDAIKQMTLLRPIGYNIQYEYDILLNDIKSNNNNNNNVATWSDVLQSKRVLLIGCGLMFFQAITGINSVILYSTTIFNIAGFNSTLLATTLVGLTNVIFTMIACKLVDTMGRKILLLIGLSLMLLSLIVLGITLLTANKYQTTQGIVSVIMVLVFIAGFAIGLGAVCWVILSEIMTTRLRSKAMSLFLSINWGSNLIISLFTLTLINKFGNVNSNNDDMIYKAGQKNGVARLFLVFASFTFITWLFVFFYVPETKGSNPDDQLVKPLLSINDDDNNDNNDNDKSNNSNNDKI